MRFLSLWPVGTLLLTAAVAAASSSFKKTLTKRTHNHLDIERLQRPEINYGRYANMVYDGMFWIILVTVGGQKLSMIFDTGSADLWTASNLLPPAQQANVSQGNVYRPNKSSIYSEMPLYTFEDTYGDGSGAFGQVGRDVVIIGGSTIIKFPFGVATNITYPQGEVSGSRRTDGILGMGFNTQSGILPVQKRTWIEYLAASDEERLFGTSLKLNASSFVNFGYVNKSAYAGEMTVVKVSDTFPLLGTAWIASDIQFGSKSQIFASPPVYMIFDTGNSDLSLPTAVVEEYCANVPGSRSFLNTTWIYPCEEKVPPLDFIFDPALSGPKKISIPGDALKIKSKLPGYCTTKMLARNPKRDLLSAGAPFFISNYVVFNYTIPSLGFASQVN